MSREYEGRALPVLIVADDNERVDDRIGRINKYRTPDEALPVPVCEEANPRALFLLAQRRIRDYFMAGADSRGIILVDLHWGDHAPYMGCDLIHWLRASDYRQTVIVDTEHPTDVEPLCSLLPVALGWYRFSDRLLRGPWPEGLDTERADAALAVARRLALWQTIARLNEIWHAIKWGAVGGAADWQRARLLATLLLPEESARVADTRLTQALSEEDLGSVRDAVNLYEAVMLDMVD